ncbi:prolyl oligopeptidase family serine peptidase [Candidatus Bathyarchaeota archaeon]|nr:prolyl oligopeptidase family serine peptidase [Candidatus Bathyarchaeota archaeon]
MASIKGTYTIEKHFIGENKVPTLWFYHKTKKAKPVIILLHGWTGTKEGMLVNCLRIADKGFYSISVDARMHGDRLDPEFWGKFAENFPRTFFTIVVETAKDIKHIIDFLETRDDIDSTRIGIMGVSMGGFITLVATFLEKRIKASASVIGTANFPLFVERMLSLKVLPFKEKPMCEPDEETRKLYRDFDPLNNLEKFPPTALLLTGGLLDMFIPKEGIQGLYDALKPYYQNYTNRLKLKFFNVGHEYPPEMEAEVIKWFRNHLHKMKVKS